MQKSVLPGTRTQLSTIAYKFVALTHMHWQGAENPRRHPDFHGVDAFQSRSFLIFRNRALGEKGFWIKASKR